jgi:hypothetical protein
MLNAVFHIQFVDNLSFIGEHTEKYIYYLNFLIIQMN